MSCSLIPLKEKEKEEEEEKLRDHRSRRLATTDQRKYLCKSCSVLFFLFSSHAVPTGNYLNVSRRIYIFFYSHCFLVVSRGRGSLMQCDEVCWNNFTLPEMCLIPEGQFLAWLWQFYLFRLNFSFELGNLTFSWWLIALNVNYGEVYAERIYLQISKRWKVESEALVLFDGVSLERLACLDVFVGYSE